MQRLCLVVSRSLQTSAAALQAASPVHGVEPGAKAVLYGILRDTPTPLNSAQIWQQAEEAGLKSKRHTKLMLQAMRKAGAVQTKPMGKGQNYVYALRSSPKKDEASNASQGIISNSASAYV